MIGPIEPPYFAVPLTVTTMATTPDSGANLPTTPEDVETKATVADTAQP